MGHKVAKCIFYDEASNIVFSAHGRPAKNMFIPVPQRGDWSDGMPKLYGAFSAGAIDRRREGITVHYRCAGFIKSTSVPGLVSRVPWLKL
ncbi:hypothetical protein NVP1139A_28 [Vibrio phage 1.139.A._10N.261.48.C6]|nr:hypothetical protein NVP1139A_28 [Vibrio phage 1.139.A._10N.261.48.C6]AUR90263.1 hypothetical protein NVP1139B_28 [Vibrio phage 1.139.B._10N.261.48.C6]AUR95585.1 hypothetical protein NVP1209O_28 [Vibrio phage 1.209.O._10N.222.52.B2]